MYTVPREQVTTMRHIARSAQREIKDKTGMRITLLLCATESLRSTPEDMMKEIALALGMSPECYKMKTRSRNIVELRFLAAMFLRRHYPYLTLHRISGLFGGFDHTSIMSGLARANNLIYTEDERFTEKYNKVEKAIDIWLRKEA